MVPWVGLWKMKAFWIFVQWISAPLALRIKVAGACSIKIEKLEVHKYGEVAVQQVPFAGIVLQFRWSSLAHQT